MNTQFKNSSLGFYLYAFIIVIIVVASVFVFWYMTTGYRLGTYPEETRLGSVYIGGLREEDVIPKMNDKTAIWYNDDSIIFQLEYQGYDYEFDRDLFYFDLELSTYNINDGLTNPVYVNYQQNDRELVLSEIQSLPFLQGVIDNVDLEALIGDILDDAALMKSYSTKHVEDYIIDPSASEEVISTATFYVPDTVDIDMFLDHINSVYTDGRIISQEQVLFDMIEIFGGTLDDAEMSLLSSGMLALIQQSNFYINEVHYNPIFTNNNYTIDTYPYFGRNAKINQIVDENFTFYNPNESDYYFTLEKVNENEGTISLHGLPFVSTIEVTVEETEVPFITQTTTNSDLLQNGYNGVIVEVHRTITDIYDNVESEQMIVFEFYPPIKEIILE
ncbi:MAG: hypothetical protein UMR38_00805 [Candidatus Izemoplasma sp.]|nr:hypothetical protein [Candidatus Izemoplasma sp.]